MTRYSDSAYSYRNDPGVPAFDDSRPVFVFDGTCVLCSGGARWMMALDGSRTIAFTPAQGKIGAALYRHYALPMDDTYLLLHRGHAYGMSGGYFRVFEILGGPWKILKILGLLPRGLRDRVYRLFARNRYRWFGTAEHCAILTEEQRRRLL